MDGFHFYKEGGGGAEDCYVVQHMNLNKMAFFLLFGFLSGHSMQKNQFSRKAAFAKHVQLRLCRDFT